MKTKLSGHVFRVVNLLAGFRKNPTPGGMASIPVGGKNVPVVDLVANLQGMVDRDTAVREAKDAVGTAILKRDESKPEDRQLVKDLRQVLPQILGSEPTELGTFGVGVTKRAKATTNTNAVANARRASRRTKKANALATVEATAPQVVVLDSEGKPIGPEAPSANEAPASTAPAPAPTGSTSH
jgi:hypothetical protein